MSGRRSGICRGGGNGRGSGHGRGRGAVVSVNESAIYHTIGKSATGKECRPKEDRHRPLSPLSIIGFVPSPSLTPILIPPPRISRRVPIPIPPPFVPLAPSIIAPQLLPGTPPLIAPPFVPFIAPTTVPFRVVCARSTVVSFGVAV